VDGETRRPVQAPTRSRRESAAATRRALIDAAADLIADHGPAAASVTAITGRSGVSRGLIGFYFGSKDQLLVEVIDRSMGELESALRRAVSSARPPSFAALSQAFIACVATGSGRVAVNSLAHVLSQRDAVADAYERGVRRLIEVAATVDRGPAGEGARYAATYVAAMLAFGLQLALDPKLDPRIGLAIGAAFDAAAQDTTTAGRA
jgi:AcrR family transcriptional regulator